MRRKRGKNVMGKTLTKSRLHFSSFEIKVIALVFMTLDHFGAYQTFTTDPVLNDFFRIVGRIAAPLFLFIVVESLRHTHSKIKFLVRLYLAGVIIEISNRVVESAFHSFDIGNILPTFFYVALLVTAIEHIIERKDHKSVFISIACLSIPFFIVPINIILCESGYVEIWNAISIFVPSIFTVEYSIIFVLLGIIWYFINNKKINCIVFAILSLLCFIVPAEIFFMVPRYFQPIYFSVCTLFADTQWYMCLAIPFMLLYDGTKGRGMKYFFYIYYPVHVYILITISYLRFANF